MAGNNPPGRSPTPGLGDLLNLVGSNNPLTALGKVVEQFRTGVAGFIDVVSTFKDTLDNLNAIAKRTNALLDEVEGPMRILLPQMTKSAEQATRMMNTLSGPVDRVAPGLDQLAKTLSNPIVAEFPRRMNEAMDVVSSIPKALGPLSQMAEMAGGIFGGARSFSSPFRGRGASAITPPADVAPGQAAPLVVVVEPGAMAIRQARRPATKTPARKAAAKKTSAKKTGAKKTSAKKTSAKRAGATKSSSRSTGSAGTTVARSAATSSAPRKAAAKRSTARKAAPGR